MCWCMWCMYTLSYSGSAAGNSVLIFPGSGDTGLADLHMLVASAVELGVVFQYVTVTTFSGLLQLRMETSRLPVCTGKVFYSTTMFSLSCVRNLLDEGFSSPCILPSSHLHDSVLCTQVADVNWDGKNELVLGTYGKVIPNHIHYITYVYYFSDTESILHIFFCRKFLSIS